MEFSHWRNLPVEGGVSFIEKLKNWRWYHWTIAGLSLAYALIFVYMLVVRPGTQESYHAFFNVYQGIPPLFAGVCGLINAAKGRHRSRSARAGWVLIGLGCLSFTAGQATWTYFESVLGQEVPFPGWPDAGYLGTYPLLIVGSALLFNSNQVVGRARLLMDSAIAASALGMLSWYFIIGRMWADTEMTLLGKLISVGYPLGDISIIFMALVTFNSLQGDRAGRRSLGLLATGVVLVTIADTVFLVMNLGDGYETGSWNDWGWSFGWLLIAFASLNKVWSKSSAESLPTHRKSSRAAWVWSTLRAYGPYMACGTALSITFGADYISNGRIEVAGHPEALLLASLLLVRQLFMIQENVGLTKRITLINEDLEHRVEQRTQQLTCLQALARAVNTTLSVDAVLQEGSQHAALLLEADALAIWLNKDHLAARRAIELKHSVGFVEHPDFLSALDEKVKFVKESPIILNEEREGGTWSTLIAKIVWHDEEIGILTATRFASEYASADFQLLESVIVEIGSALRNSLRHALAVEAADRDPVTGLLNHRAFHQKLQQMLRRAEEQEAQLSIAVLDLNNFKLFNDTYGHMNGDHVLKTVAKALSSATPKDGLVARYGGDEFVLALPRCSGDDMEALTTAISSQLAEMGFSKADDDRKIPITLSGGIATFPEDATSRHDLFAVADQALYSSKATDSGVSRMSSQQRANRALKTESSFEVLDALVSAVDNKDRYTRKHSEDVTEYALWIAEELGLSEETMRTIRIAGLLHDVGKIGVPDDILRKPGRLTPEEYEIMKRHPRLGELIVSAIPGMEGIVDGVRSHHERWDGQGYPDQLARDQIPFLGRILAVADAFSAMTTDRPYRKGMDWDMALQQIDEHKGTQFDPELAELFLRAAAKRRTDTAFGVLDAA